MTPDPSTGSTPPADDRVRSRERLKEIADLGLTSSATDPVLQSITREAAEALGLPIGLVSIVMDEAQHFAAEHGLQGWMKETRGTPIEWSFCANAVRSGRPFIVSDAVRHPAVRDNPLVRNEGVRCYAGVPLVTTRNHVVGTLCVIGEESREFTEEDLATLRRLADRAMERIESRRSAG